MTILTHEIKIPAAQKKFQRVALGADVSVTIEIYAAEHATACVLVESVYQSTKGDVEINTHAASGARIFVAVCVRVSSENALAINSVQRHESPHAESRIWVRKIVSDEAAATYQGLIHVAEAAVGTVVSQDDKTLLDGQRARAESQPILEVLTNEVSCSHGSALGRVDPQMVWYMQTRGIAVDAARALLYQAFFDEVRAHVLSEG
jgi:Fe-S cluster assembly scaffold protein SufB